MNVGTPSMLVHPKGVWDLGNYQGERIDKKKENIDGTTERMTVPYTRLTFVKEQPKYQSLAELDETFFFPITYPLVAIVMGFIALLFYWLIGWDTLWFSVAGLIMFVLLAIINYLKNYTSGKLRITIIYYRGLNKIIKEMGTHYIIIADIKDEYVVPGEEVGVHHVYVTPLADNAISTIQKDVEIATPIFEAINKMRDIVNVKIPRNMEINSQEREIQINSIILENLSAKKGEISKFLYQLIVKDGELLDPQGNPRRE